MNAYDFPFSASVIGVVLEILEADARRIAKAAQETFERCLLPLLFSRI